jgi:UDP-N-acetylglucosamine:LPS N-acetylglucosamine transferase
VSATRGPEVLLLITDAGGGHRAAANALIAAAERPRRRFRLRILPIQEALLPVDPWHRLTGRTIESAYNDMVRAGRTRHLIPLLRLGQWMGRRVHGRLVACLARALGEARPAAVVSLMPNVNAVARDALRRARPGTPFLVALTDYVDFPPHFWLEPGCDRVVVGSDEALEQGLALGIPRERLTRSSGMILHPRHDATDRAEARGRVRDELGIPRDAFTALVLFGGKGSPEVAEVAAGLLRESLDAHAIAVCGDNAPLLDRVRQEARELGGRLHPLGFSERVPELMAAADVLLSKPGPGSLAEAFHAGLPVAAIENAFTVPQERANARLLRERGLGLVATSARELAVVAAGLARGPERLARLRAAVAALPRNRAAHECLDAIEGELSGTQGQPA